MLDLLRNVTVDRLAADMPGERTAVASEGRDSLLFGVRQRGESHRGSDCAREVSNATNASR